MQAFKTLTARSVALPIDHIDTDQIIPAQFLKVTDKQGLGKHAFSNWRYDKQGNENPDFVLNQQAFADASILIAGENFGCGSSREHAPWALLDYGFRVVIAPSIADIFRNNALKNGLLPITVPHQFHASLMEQAGAEMTIDLETCMVKAGNLRYGFTIEPFARYCLLEGMDQMEFLLRMDAEIQAYEERIA